MPQAHRKEVLYLGHFPQPALLEIHLSLLSWYLTQMSCPDLAMFPATDTNCIELLVIRIVITSGIPKVIDKARVRPLVFEGVNVSIVGP